MDLAGNTNAALVLLGDYVDRGPDSAAALQGVGDLQRQFPDRVVALLGNHEDWLLDWLDADEEDFSWLFADHDLTTVKSFLSTLELAHVFGLDGPAIDASALDGVTLNRNLKKAISTKHSEPLRWLR